MDPMEQAMVDVERLRETLPKLREDFTVSGRIRYHQTLLDLVERQHNMYTRLMLIDDPEAKYIAADMQRVAEDYMGKVKDLTMNDFFTKIKKELDFEINLLKGKEDRG